MESAIENIEKARKVLRIREALGSVRKKKAIEHLDNAEKILNNFEEIKEPLEISNISKINFVNGGLFGFILGALTTITILYT